MPQIEATFVVEPYDITVTTDTSNIQVQPTVLDLNIFSAGYSNPAGNTGELQYNNGGILGGVPVAFYTAGNIVFANVTNVKLPGGSNAYFLQTDGTGNLTWAPGTVNANTGNGVAVGANTQIQITDGTGNFVSAPGFTFNYISNTLTVPGNTTISGNLQSGNANLGNVAIANYFIGNGAFLTGIDSSQILNGNSNVKVYANANVAISATGIANIVQVSSNQFSVNKTVSIQQAKEKVTVNAASATTTVFFEILDGAIMYMTGNSAANFTLNIRGNSTVTLDSMMSANESLTCTFINTSGSPSYYITQVQIDGSNVTPVWPVNGIPSSGTSNGIDAYTFNIIKTAANTYKVLGSKLGFQ